MPSAQAQQSQTLFPYPQAPDELATLRQRCNYLVDHFWDRCNFATAFSSKERLNKAFGDWVGFMPHASADTVHMAIDRLIAKFNKEPRKTLDLAQMAENWLWSDTAAIHSDEVYLPFAKAAAGNKKLSAAERARFAAHTRILENSSVGMALPSMQLYSPFGEKSLLSDYKAKMVIVLFNDPECLDCKMTRVRLSADYNANKLIERGDLKIICVYPGGANDAEWVSVAPEYPKNWVVVAAPDADDLFDLRTMPNIYYADEAGVIRVKNIQIDNLLNAMRMLNQ